MLNSGGFLSAARKILFRSINTQSTIKFPLKALGLYNFIRDFGLAYSTNRGGGNLISGGGILYLGRGHVSGMKKCFGTT